MKLKLIFKVICAVLAVPAVLSFAIYTLDQNGFFHIKNIEIFLVARESQKNFSKPYVEKLNNTFESYRGKSLIRFSLQNVSEILKSEKWIKEFHITRSWPSELEIQIEPHTLSYLLTDSQRLNQGLMRPMTDQGDVLSEIDSRQAPSLALLKGDIFLRDGEKRKQALELLKALPAEGKISFENVSEVNYNRKDGFWLELIRSDLKIKLGEDQFAVKSARVSQVLDYLEKRDLKARVIDANLSKKVLVRLQQSP